jgi:heptosyltransferase-2
MGALLTDRVPDKKHLGLKHEIDYTLGLLRYMGIKSADRKLYVPVDREGEKRVRRTLEDSGIKESDMIVTINPGASCRSKRWPIQRFAEVADALIRKLGVKVVIVSGSSDKRFADLTASTMKTPGALNLSGMTTIRELACLLKRSSLFISNDSGPVHIACAVGTPVISIFGRSDRGLSPRRWGPTNAADRALHKYVGCDVCLAHKCRIELKCLDAITVDEVIRNAEEMLGEQSLSPAGK